jgi:hypothetical protein
MSGQMKITRTRTAAQDLWVEHWHNDVRLHYFVVRAGQPINIYEEDGYRTDVQPHRLKLDAAVASNVSGSEPEERQEEARDRLERASGDDGDEEKVYGPLFVDPGEG